MTWTGIEAAFELPPFVCMGCWQSLADDDDLRAHIDVCPSWESASAAELSEGDHVWIEMDDYVGSLTVAAPLGPALGGGIGVEFATDEDEDELNVIFDDDEIVRVVFHDDSDDLDEVDDENDVYVDDADMREQPLEGRPSPKVASPPRPVDESGDEATVNGVPVSQLRSQEDRDRQVRRVLAEWLAPLGAPDPTLGRIGFSESPKSALPALTVRRGTKGIGRYLKDSKVLIVNDEADRPAALGAAVASGLEVLHPLREHAVGELLLDREAKPMGAWGNVLGFMSEIRSTMSAAPVALLDLDTRELFTVSDELRPALLDRLDRMGLTVSVVHPPDPLTGLGPRLSWFSDFGERTWEDIDPRYAVPAGVEFKMTASLAAELPPEVVAAFEEQLATTGFDPTPRRSERAFWESTNGVLSNDDLKTYRRLTPRSVELPEDWEILWEMSVELSEPHAPVLCALYLHDLHPEWWDTLPLTEHVSGGTLLGHSMSQPKWFRQDMTRDSERRLQCAVALVVEGVGDLKGLRKVSREEIACATCSRPFERGCCRLGRSISGTPPRSVAVASTWRGLRSNGISHPFSVTAYWRTCGRSWPRPVESSLPT